ncbi:MAG: hypothetical protein LBC62_03195 [Treponema sp.]|jgi:predicted nucleotidyltransferase|nr:hypothetical protein [Treponema sp.]
MAADFEAVRNSIEGYIADVKKAMPIDKVYLYGSYAKGNPALFRYQNWRTTILL